jgi:gamma-glutamylputrescine oxidase
MVSIWEKETFLADQDVIIVGSGFTGLWSAIYLKKKKPDLKITILERGVIPTGASSRNAGFACFGSLTELVADANTIGKDQMLELVEMRYKGLQRIQKYFSRGAIDFDLCGGYELLEETTDTTEIESNINYLNSLLRDITGSKKTFRLEDDKIAEFGFGQTKHLVKNVQEGYLHSGKLLKALLQKVYSLDVQVLNGVEITELDAGKNGVQIKTKQGLNFFSKKVLVCTNAFGKHLLPQEEIIPVRGQVLLTSPISKLPWCGTFHSDEGFYYFRNLGKKILLGGARNKAFEAESTDEFGTTENIQQELERYLAEVILPNHKGDYTIEHRWSGIMGMGTERMPLIKEASPNVFCAVRLGGMGVALAPVAAQKVTELMF